MTALPDRPNTALLVIDVQNDVVAEAYRRDEVIANINALVEKARAQHVPVVWVQDSLDGMPHDGKEWQLATSFGLARRDDAEPLVHKDYGDAFEATTLEAVLAERGVGRLVVAGAHSDACVRSTIHGAFVRGYDVTLVADAHTTEDLSPYGAPGPELVIAHTNLYWTNQKAPGRTAATVNTAEVSFAVADAE